MQKLTKQQKYTNSKYLKTFKINARFKGDDGLLRQLENAEERWVAVGWDVVAVEVIDPDLLSGVQPADASRVAGLVASIVSWRGVGSDRVDARPTL